MRSAIVFLSAIVMIVVAGAPSGAIIDRKSDLAIAAELAPIFYQSLGEVPRADYITNFDFDGDWKGDNNWENLDDRSFALRAYVYYAVLETATHYFVHYAVFHPRDYKGGLAASEALSVGIRIALERLGRDPTGGLAEDVALSHENDLEGCLVVAAKEGTDVKEATVEYVETMAHNRYLRYRTRAASNAAGDLVELEGQHPLLYVEPKGHGVLGHPMLQTSQTMRITGPLKYWYAARADDPDQTENRSEIGYDLVPILDTLWKHAQGGSNETYGVASDYAPFILKCFKDARAKSAVELKTPKRKLGIAFLGDVGGANRARPPWSWYDQTERDRPLGEWFFDPAGVIARHFETDKSFSHVYLNYPYLEK